MSEDAIEFSDKQKQFLASNADICLYGGGASGGKSFALLIDALGLDTTPDANGELPLSRIEMPYYRALLARKQYKHLYEMIDKSKSVYKQIDPGAEWLDSKLTWMFSSGAQISMLAIEDKEAAEVIQGREFAYIGCDEVGQLQTADTFLYYLSRLRSKEGLKCYLRATSNPSRYPWLRKFFGIPADGRSTYRKDTIILSDGTKEELSIQYIQALASDNPYIGSDYQARLSLLPEDERLALQDGRWDAYDSVDGQIYEHELKAMARDNRLCRVPHNPALDTYIFSDIGINDLSVFLFVQYKGSEVHIIDMLYGNNQSLIYTWIPKIKDKIRDCGYRVNRLYLPHDAAQREKGNGLSIIDQVSAIYPDVDILPKLGIADGIERTKSMFSNLWIDDRNCIYLHSTISQYRRKYDTRLDTYDKPIHDHASHFADAVRYVSYIDNPSSYDSNMLVPRAGSSIY